VCHLWGWFDTVFCLSQEVVILWLVANQCKFYRGTQARIGNIWGKYDYGYSRMSLYINGNVLTARFLVTGNYCILFDSGQLLKHDQGVPCRSNDQTWRNKFTPNMSVSLVSRRYLVEAWPRGTLVTFLT
jgi:hypothetical protein